MWTRTPLKWKSGDFRNLENIRKDLGRFNMKFVYIKTRGFTQKSFLNKILISCLSFSHVSTQSCNSINNRLINKRAAGKKNDCFEKLKMFHRKNYILLVFNRLCPWLTMDTFLNYLKHSSPLPLADLCKKYWFSVRERGKMLYTQYQSIKNDPSPTCFLWAKPRQYDPIAERLLWMSHFKHNCLGVVRVRNQANW